MAKKTVTKLNSDRFHATKLNQIQPQNKTSLDSLRHWARKKKKREESQETVESEQAVVDLSPPDCE